MKFALFSHVAWPEGTEPKQVIDNLTEQVRFGEELGFYSAWHAEHHFTRYGLGSASLILGTALAQRTKSIRIGTAVLLPPLYHPVRLAEDTATLDIISGGRLDVGFGRGRPGSDYDGLSIPWEESQGRFREAIDIVKGLWTTPDFSYAGEHYNVDRTDLVPPPLQRPHPPVYLAATRTRATLEFVASTGHPLLIGQVLDTADALDLCHRWESMSREAGHDTSMAQIPFMRYFYVAETEEQARKDTWASLEWMHDLIQWRASLPGGSEVYRHLEDWRHERTTPPPDIDYMLQHRAFVGTPERCTEKIKQLQDEGIDYFGCYFSFGGTPHKKVMRSMELFAKEVMPHFA